MESILRILTLYKQHYLNEYSQNYKWQYSTLGYYDGMKIIKVKQHTDKRLAVINSNHADLTDLWYDIAENVSEGNGTYGQQNISLLKFGDDNMPDRDKAFWEDTSAFLCATFIQIDQKLDIVDIDVTSAFIEQRMNNQTNIRAIIYRTLDNADAILFMKSKQYQAIISAIESLGNMDEILYTHSVLGISRECLNQISDTGNAQDMYDETEKIDEMVLEIVSRGSDRAFKYIDNVNEVGTYSYVLGHSDAIYRISDITMKSILEKLIDNGSLNHNNGFYGKDIYNVETILKKKNIYYTPKGADATPPSGDSQNSWCKGKIEELKKDLEYIKNRKDERMYSYYQAMIQSLNMLTQYEMSQFSKIIFYMVFPSLELFHDQFKQKLKPQDKLKCEELNKVKSSITRYLEAVDAIIFHTVHTDQNFLMVPGYSGVLYDIPTQLCFSYMAFIGLSINCLNDTPGSRYECFLVPALQVSTETRFIGFDLSPDNRLIQVTIPQRMLFMQRSTLLILCHEVAHYVGDGTRNREFRLQEMVRIFGYVMAEFIYNKLTGEYNRDTKRDRKELIDLVSKQKQQVTIYLTKKIYSVLKRHLENKEEDKKFHWYVLEPYISKVCDSVMLDMDYKLRDHIRAIPQEERKMLEKENNHDILLLLDDIYDEVEQRLREWVSNGLSDQMTRTIEYGISEMYSDVVSILTLDAGWEHYMEAYLVEEGCTIRDISDSVPDSGIPLDSFTENRIAVVVDSITDIEEGNNAAHEERDWEKFLEKSASQNPDGIYEIAKAIDIRIKRERATAQNLNQNVQQITKDISSDNECKSMKDELEDIIYSIDAVWTHEKKYLKKCIKDIKHLLDTEKEGNLQLLRKYYLNFTEKKDNENFLKSMDELNKKYIKIIEQQYHTAVAKMYAEGTKSTKNAENINA